MSDDGSPTVPEERSAGAMLRAARERQGLHIAALAAAIKVPPAKLDALENDRYGELTDITFARALAHSVCRVLKIDARPVLEQLPSAPHSTLEKAERSLKTPFRERPGAAEPGEARLWHQPVFWIVAILLVAAAAFLWWPSRSQWLPAWPWLGKSTAAAGDAATPVTQRPPAPPPAARTPAAAPRAEPASTAAPVIEVAASGPAVVTETVHSAPPAAAAGDAQALPAGLLIVRASEPSWVEVREARGAVLLSRTLQPGESVGLDGRLPMRLIIGNATGTEVMLRGKPLALAPADRDNVVRMDLR